MSNRNTNLVRLPWHPFYETFQSLFSEWYKQHGKKDAMKRRYERARSELWDVRECHDSEGWILQQVQDSEAGSFTLIRFHFINQKVYNNVYATRIKTTEINDTTRDTVETDALVIVQQCDRNRLTGLVITANGKIWFGYTDLTVNEDDSVSFSTSANVCYFAELLSGEDYHALKTASQDFLIFAILISQREASVIINRDNDAPSKNENEKQEKNGKLEFECLGDVFDVACKLETPECVDETYSPVLKLYSRQSFEYTVTTSPIHVATPYDTRQYLLTEGR